MEVTFNEWVDREEIPTQPLYIIYKFKILTYLINLYPTPMGSPFLYTKEIESALGFSFVDIRRDYYCRSRILDV